MSTGFRENNKGITLVELIVVILIIGVLSGGAAIAFSIVYNARTERVAKNICSVMTKAREKAMALEDSDTEAISVRLWQDANDEYKIAIYKGSSVLDTEEVENLGKYVTIKAGKRDTANGAGTSIGTLISDPASGNEAKTLEYTFKKSTGGIRKAGRATVSSAEDYYLDLFVEGSDNFKIIVVPTTGVCYISEQY